MFAVPGWNLSAPLKAEPEKAPSTNAKKRKRNHGKKGGDVTEDNVADMYARVVEGSKPAEAKQADAKGKESGKQNAGKPKNKKQRRESEIGATEEAATVTGKSEKNDDAAASKSEEKAQPHSKKQKKDKNKDKKSSQPQPDAASATAPASLPPPVPLPAANTKLTPLQAKMREKLSGARFRYLNEALYTTPSQNSLKLISENPEMFTEYHAGFRQQVAVWPENPVDTFVELVRARAKVRESWRDKRGGKFGRNKGGKHGGEDEDSDAEQQRQEAEKKKLKPLPRTHGTCVLADLGCGDAALATKLTPQSAKLHLQIHSFDLAAPSPLITRADIANLPLADGSVDVAIFCLALMGTNWTDFIDEAWRVLRWKGELWIAEIKSRFGRVQQGPRKKGEAVNHSVGKRQKKPSATDTKAAKKASAEQEEADNDAALAVEVDGQTSTANETDVAAFVEVLRKRGFVLDAPPERPQDAVDLRNKMFVRLHFVKGIAPMRGKNVRAREEREEKGKEGGTWKPKVKGKFVDQEEEVVDEGAVLKPCVYKLR